MKLNSYFNLLLVLSIHDNFLKKVAKKYFSGDLIDIGCGQKPYKKMMSDICKSHIGVDHSDSIHTLDNVDLIGTAYNIPTADNKFDSALCTAVLEHLEEPDKAIKECNRILKTGGMAIYSIPHIWHLHEEPRDFFRYTKYGIEYLFEKNNFKIIELIPLSGFWVTIGINFTNYLERFNKGVIRYTFLFPFIYFLIYLVSKILNRIDNAERWTWMYIVVAEKEY